MARVVELNGRPTGDGCPNYVIAEIGINHNGSLEIAKKLIDVAKSQRLRRREVPEAHAREMRARRNARQDARDPLGLHLVSWSTATRSSSAWRSSSRSTTTAGRRRSTGSSPAGIPTRSTFMKQFRTPCIKIPSASLTDRELLESVRDSGMPIMLSTGMSSMEQIDAAVALVGTKNLLLAHATSTYPCPKEELNLRMITTLREHVRLPDRLLGARSRSGHDDGRRGAGRLLRRAAHHARSGHVGQRSGGLDRAGRTQAAGQGHPQRRSRPGRRQEAGLSTAKSWPPAGCG